jgi:hypothetical protein
MRLRFRLTRPLSAPAEPELAARAEDWLRGRADLDRLADLGHRRRLIRPKSLWNGGGPPRRRPTGLAGRAQLTHLSARGIGREDLAPLGHLDTCETTHPL